MMNTPTENTEATSLQDLSINQLISAFRRLKLSSALWLLGGVVSTALFLFYAGGKFNHYLEKDVIDSISVQNNHLNSLNNEQRITIGRQGDSIVKLKSLVAPRPVGHSVSKFNNADAKFNNQVDNSDNVSITNSDGAK